MEAHEPPTSRTSSAQPTSSTKRRKVTSVARWTQALAAPPPRTGAIVSARRGDRVPLRHASMSAGDFHVFRSRATSMRHLRAPRPSRSRRYRDEEAKPKSSCNRRSQKRRSSRPSCQSMERSTCMTAQRRASSACASQPATSRLRRSTSSGNASTMSDQSIASNAAASLNVVRASLGSSASTRRSTEPHGAPPVSRSAVSTMRGAARPSAAIASTARHVANGSPATRRAISRVSRQSGATQRGHRIRSVVLGSPSMSGPSSAQSPSVAAGSSAVVRSFSRGRPLPSRMIASKARTVRPSAIASHACSVSGCATATSNRTCVHERAPRSNAADTLERPSSARTTRAQVCSSRADTPRRSPA